MEQFESLKALVDEITNSPEQAVVEEIESIRWSFRMFQGNLSDLVRPLKSLEESPQAIKLWLVDHEQDLYRLFEEIGRLLHNFLASAMSLVDHTRGHIERLYSGDEFSWFVEDYKAEVTKRFLNSANHQLAQGLRNYTQHKSLPFVGSVLHWNRDKGEKRAFIVSSGCLLEWDGWKPLARAKIEGMKHGVPIRQFAEEYHAEVRSFAQWLWTKQMEIHKQDIDRLNEMKEQARSAFEQAGLGDMLNQNRDQEGV